ncbi:hypothetical protein PBRA_005344 [Plasmodiophora brassicae]|uniref:Tc1-like transposase DDE domain-containing protein n=1 Tax=Plasmodiophora brassicae TaxID=37360 RepID=A0A0G4INJ6_PLABS|nr:hypothetical protein PBRA_005344 [Plasmodiophora brassicae]
MHLVRWSRESLVFLDEFGVDNRDMLRTKGFCLVGKRLIYRGQFSRKPRRSMLAFASVRGLETFSLWKGLSIARHFSTAVVSSFCIILTYARIRVVCLSGSWTVLGSIAIQASSISCDRWALCRFFLPAYCPFYNSIELLFGMIKRRLRELYDERSGSDITAVINDVLVEFSNRSMEEVFKKCGYVCDHEFDPSIGMHCDLKDLEFDVTVENRAT